MVVSYSRVDKGRILIPNSILNNFQTQFYHISRDYDQFEDVNLLVLNPVYHLEDNTYKIGKNNRINLGRDNLEHIIGVENRVVIMGLKENIEIFAIEDYKKMFNLDL